MDHDNRESWLNRVASGMAPLFGALDAPLPSRVRVMIRWTPTEVPVKIKTRRLYG